MNEIRTGFIPDVRTTDDFTLGSQKISGEILQPTRNWMEFLPRPETHLRIIDYSNFTG